MKIVIDIDDEQVLFDIKNRGLIADTKTGKVILNAIYNGTQLPKGHGRLKDIDKIIADGTRKGFCEWYDEMKYAPTIIEADTTRDCKTCGHSNDGKRAETEECHECMWVNNYIGGGTE